MEEARKIEELDFFALGHPLVNALMEYCKGEDLGQPYSILPINADKYHREHPILSTDEKKIVEQFSQNHAELFLFLFESEICGVFIERIIKPIVVTRDGKILKSLSKTLEIPRNLIQLMDSRTHENSKVNFPPLNKEDMENFRWLWG